jgi:hypothetical protein
MAGMDFIAQQLEIHSVLWRVSDVVLEADILVYMYDILYLHFVWPSGSQ